MHLQKCTYNASGLARVHKVSIEFNTIRRRRRFRLSGEKSYLMIGSLGSDAQLFSKRLMLPL